MLSDQQCVRLDTMELNLQIVKNLGKRKAAKYFKNLERYLTLKINKRQFQKLCYSVIGNDNAKLHNCLINAILSNAHLAHAKQTQTQDDHDINLCTGSVGHGPLPVRMQYPQFTKLLRGSLGDSLRGSPQKPRSKKDHHSQELPSALGHKRRASPSINIGEDRKSKEKNTFTEVVSVGTEAPSMNIQEARQSQEKKIGNDEMSISNKDHSMNFQEACAFQTKHAGSEVISVGNKTHSVNVEEAQKSRVIAEMISMNSESISLYDVGFLELEGMEHGRGSSFAQTRNPIMPPLGISLAAGGLLSRARSSATAFHLGTSVVPEGCQSNAELPDTMSLMKLMEKRLEQEGLSLSLDCADLLNNALNAYIKRLIKASADLARSRHGLDIRSWQQAHKQKMNGRFSASLHDLKVAMQLEPKSLGVGWPVLLEKISLLSIEE